jgi:hypothetical protein
MELAYQELNQREYELTKHVSLLQFAPELVALRATGKCQVIVPEEVFDLDGPDHYFRRIKTVAVSIPCIMGPYTSLGCKVVLLKSEIRRTAAVGDNGYASTGPEDSRFSTYYGGIQSIVASASQNDSGMFEANLRDERYLPFEGLGAISTWSVELPWEVPQFDLDTIADVVLHIRYTAREGGDLFRKQAVANIKNLLAEPKPRVLRDSSRCGTSFPENGQSSNRFRSAGQRTTPNYRSSCSTNTTRSGVVEASNRSTSSISSRRRRRQ